METSDWPRTYDHAAENYLDIRERVAPFCLDEVVSELRLEPGDRVLDIACGPGGVALRAAQQVGDGAVIGCDISEQMLRLARLRAEELDVANVTFEVADMNRLPYEPGTFDAVACSLGIFFAEDITAAFSSAWSLVKPGGRLAVATIARNMFAPVSNVFLDHAQAHLPDLAVDLPWWRTGDLFELRNLVRAAGLPDARVTHRDYQTRLLALSDWWQFILGSGFRNVALRMDEAALVLVRTEVEEWLRANTIDSLATGINYVTCTRPDDH
ncbi:Ubiquinone/menaquinone biosynthesis C-methylase UbiE [Actinokineospora alba]|uniref:Ubiquinone/menaquinone biosynthesis C-methylase UbiE n=1 Tax=Actinokineospora alba TaxID=504798 RepID=A0A1H0L7B4_9PSEU|nr:methyltransferase domain-containing protein [Actinokineospora alba]TDP67219.1 ubiquinone/menaquinone biosynthesis C-methylase UbiE [Actinokineospora alba]SDJ04030.1 Ubiquinone/menaquinone biosynthesis C-methylase UbiE [Actinokineospora alba]SDO63851.1 Ubiquinone/menaquinone biosynthesis C-methylase UbiE [Actinokineospora alba]